MSPDVNQLEGRGPELSRDVTGGVTEEVPRPAPAPRGRVDWTLCFYLISGAHPSLEACSRVDSSSVGGRRPL